MNIRYVYGELHVGFMLANMFDYKTNKQNRFADFTIQITFISENAAHLQLYKLILKVQRIY